MADFQPLLSNHTWLAINPETRAKIRELFNIPRSGHVEVLDGKVMTDGTMLEDFEHLTVEKMQQHLKSTETDFFVLFNQVVTRIEQPLPEGVTVYEETTPVETVPTETVTVDSPKIPETSTPIAEVKVDTRPSVMDSISPETKAILEKRNKK